MSVSSRSSPRCIIIAGPNGAGKTTFAREFLSKEAGVVHFVNPDLIASGLSPLRPELAALAAGQDFPLTEPDEVIEIPQDFTALLKSDPDTAKREQLRVREEFLALLGAGLVCRAFDRNAARPRYLFYRDE